MGALMAETSESDFAKMATVTFCIPPHELKLLEFAANECGQTKSKFCYIQVRNALRQLGVLPMPQVPKFNGSAGAQRGTAVP